jgi:hypothetical protein
MFIIIRVQELYETARLVESSDPRTSLYASCALWCFARNLKNRARIGRVNGIQVRPKEGGSTRGLESGDVALGLIPGCCRFLIVGTFWELWTEKQNVEVG